MNDVKIIISEVLGAKLFTTNADGEKELDESRVLCKFEKRFGKLADGENMGYANMPAEDAIKGSAIATGKEVLNYTKTEVLRKKDGEVQMNDDGTAQIIYRFKHISNNSRTKAQVQAAAAALVLAEENEVDKTIIEAED